MTLLIDNIRAKFDNNLLFEGVNLNIASGQLVALMGRNGTGKSTLLKALAGYDTCVQGTIKINEEIVDLTNAETLHNHMGFIAVKIVPYGAVSLLDFILSGRSAKRNFMDIPSKAEQELVVELLSQFDLAHKVHQSFETLSDGEQKIGLIARGVFRDARIFLLDEPESFLDIHNKEILFGWLTTLAQQGKTILFSTHQPEMVQRYATKVLYIAENQLNLADVGELDRVVQLLK
jgi:iron complex transport system ATP-binding protein